VDNNNVIASDRDKLRVDTNQ